MQSIKYNVQLETGSLVHAMITDSLKHVQEHGSLPGDAKTKIIKNAIAKYQMSIASVGFENAESQDEANRQVALAEGMARAWLKLRLPFFLEHYEILMVEDEASLALTEDIHLMTRLDAVVRRKEDGNISALEFKTTGTDYPDYFESWRYSSQTASHVLDVKFRTGEEASSVLMEFLYKGYKREGVLYSPLVRGYVKRGLPPFDETEYSYDSSNSRRKGWESFNVWEERFPKPEWMSNTEYWVEHFLDNTVLQAQLFSREIFRRDEEVETWRRQVILEQDLVRTGLDRLKEPERFGPQPIMDAYFPARMDDSCYSNKYRKKCLFLPLCFGEVDNARESGLYKERVPHHLQEFEV